MNHYRAGGAAHEEIKMINKMNKIKLIEMGGRDNGSIAPLGEIYQGVTRSIAQYTKMELSLYWVQSMVN